MIHETLPIEIALCSNFEELRKVIKSLPDFYVINGTRTGYSKNDILRLIDSVELDYLPVNYITRTFGLREKVMAIKGYPKERIEYLCNND